MSMYFADVHSVGPGAFTATATVRMLLLEDGISALGHIIAAVGTLRTQPSVTWQH